MTTTSTKKYKHLQVTQPVSVVQVEEGSSLRYAGQKVLIMGPTGSGKSSFIEVLGLKGTSTISSNGLDGCTQSISAYRLNNVTWNGSAIYLVDSPGFADSKISEMSIVSMLQRWINDNGYFHHILYFTPITSIRLPGSQRQVLKTFQALGGIKAADDITIVTTMWDNIWGERPAIRAEKTYEQLRDNIWKEFIEAGSQITRFYNTEKSALAILDEAFSQGGRMHFSVENHRNNIQGSPFANNLLTNLQTRIENLHSHIPTLKDELAHAEAQGDKLLVSTLRPQLQAAEDDLTRFRKELDYSGLLPPPPPPPPPPSAAPAPVSEASGTTPEEVTKDSVQQSTLKLSAQPSSTHLPIVEPDSDDSAPIPTGILNNTNTHSVLDDNLAIDVDRPSSPTTETPSASRPAVPEVQAVPQHLRVRARRAPGRFAHIMEIMKCWGHAVGERHEN